MALSPGTRLGPYEIQSAIGAGGMGEVYKARDTRLDRSVAIKVLPTEVTADPDRRARFEREARAIGALNHPHICVLHDVGDHEGSTFLVMEHLAGQTLAEHLEKGPLPLERALTIATEIADALSAAHRQGVIHRDLKPGNVMLTKAGGVRQGSPQAKLLDFGLARLARPSAGTGASATLSSVGTVAGTPPYMAPEQIEGRPTDARTDLFAFGAMLYEMLTGRRAFEGESPASVMAAILEREPPPVATLQPLTPPGLDRLVRKCLMKDPDGRWQSAADVADELRWVATSGGAASAPARAAWAASRWTRIGILVVAVAGLAAGAVTLWLAPWRTSAPSGGVHVSIPVSTWGLTLQSGQGSGGLAVSPDGRSIAFVAKSSDRPPALYVRRLDDPEPTQLKGTEDARLPFFSPDGRHLAFARGYATLERVPVAGGAAQVICEAAYFEGGAWRSDGVIVYADNRGKPQLWSVPSGGGTPKLVVDSPKAEGASRYSFPEPLPDGEGIVFSSFGFGGARIHTWSPGAGMKSVMPGAHPRYLATGHLVYEDGDVLRVIAFDARRLEPVGTSIVVAQDVETGLESSLWGAGRTGSLAYAPSYTGLSSFVWRDREGRRTAVPLKPRRYRNFPALSRVGRRLAVPVATASGGTRVFVGSTDGEPLSPLTDAALSETYFPSFTHDGKWLLFTGSDAAGLYNIYRAATDGSGSVERLTRADAWQGCPSASPDGKVLLVTVVEPSSGAYHIWEKPLDASSPLRPFVRTPGVRNALNGRFSPDGRWVAYTSDATGNNEVWVKTHGQEGKGQQVSIDGGSAPVWDRRGDELFYQGPTGMMRVAFVNGRPGRPVLLFPIEGGFKNAANVGSYDYDPETDRFLVVENGKSDREPSQIYFVQNWLEKLKQKAPVR